MNHKGKENKESRGVHPFVISNVLRTAVRPRAALPALNVQSLLSESHDLDKIRIQFHDLEIFTAVWSCAPRGRPLQLCTRLQEYIMIQNTV